MAERAGRILIVDDGGPGAARLKACVASNQRIVAFADIDRDIVDAAREFRPDVALLGEALDVAGGCSLCRRLKRELAGIHILMIVAAGDLGDVEQVVDAGADDFALSPISEPELKSRVDNLLSRGL